MEQFGPLIRLAHAVNFRTHTFDRPICESFQFFIFFLPPLQTLQFLLRFFLSPCLNPSDLSLFSSHSFFSNFIFFYIDENLFDVTKIRRRLRHSSGHRGYYNQCAIPFRLDIFSDFFCLTRQADNAIADRHAPAMEGASRPQRHFSTLQLRRSN